MSSRLNSFFYVKQYERRANPMYVFLSKEGLFLLMAGYVAFGIFNGGAMSLLLLVGAFWMIWKYRFNYKYHQVQNIFLYKHLIRFLTRRVRVPYTIEEIDLENFTR